MRPLFTSDKTEKLHIKKPDTLQSKDRNNPTRWQRIKTCCIKWFEKKGMVDPLIQRR